jgi:hypothetical protein
MAGHEEDEVLWGAEAIAKEIDRTERQTHHLLYTGRLPARKVGGRWCAVRSKLRAHFADVKAADVKATKVQAA